MTVQGRPKGSKAERDVAAMLAAWWRAIEPGAEFVRTPLSGGWSRPAVRGGFKAAGDIMTTSTTFPFAIEVKRREGFAWSTLLAGKRSPVWGWWAQAEKAAAEQGGIACLWLRHNGEPWRVMVPSHVFGRIRTGISSRFVLARVLQAPRIMAGLRDGNPRSEDASVLAANALLAVPPGDLLAALGR